METAPQQPGSEALPEALELVADTVGQLMEYWGFKHIMGRIWTALYLSSRPLSAPELAESLHISAGAVSMTLKELLDWGAVRRVSLRDSRKDHFVAENNIWKMLSRVLAERESRRIQETLENLRIAIGDLKKRSADAEQQFQTKRLEELKELVVVGDRLLKLFLAGAKIDFSPLRIFGNERATTP
jgi:DNA-binding transcriptional regulator GbsR (MarR family)